MRARTKPPSQSLPGPNRWILAFAALAAFLPGCATFRPEAPAGPTFALARPGPTRLGRAFAPGQERHPGESGFALLPYGLEALVARAALADTSDRTIDAEYYIYDHDEAGNFLTSRLLSAADRGVRVRLLLDDFNFGSERELMALCAHPLIQVRVFNPVAYRLRWARLLEYAIDFRRADRRMHDKLLIVDNEVAILGGRNIGDAYFNLHTKRAFRDFDVLAAGPVTAEASASFDRFWNSGYSVPAPALVGRNPSADDLAWLRRRVQASGRRAAEFETNYAATRAGYLRSLEHEGGALVWAAGEIVSDPPEKVEGATPQTNPVAGRLAEEWARATKEILVEQSYFVPGPPGAPGFRDLPRTAAAVRILTSGADTTDVPIVYGAYRRSRQGLLASGIELYEYRQQPARRQPGQQWDQVQPPFAALHSKVLVFDRRIAWIGSYNLDPRSARLNTEIALVVPSERLAGELAAAIIDDLSPERSWRVRLTTDADRARGARGPIVWVGAVNGRPVLIRHDPATTWRRIEVFFQALIPGLGDQL